MDYLRHPYGQDDQPHHRNHHRGDNYQAPINLSPYSPAPPVEYSRYDNDDGGRSPRSYAAAYDQPPPPPRGYSSSNSPYVEYQNYPPPPPQPPQNSYVGDEDNNPHFNVPGFSEGQFSHKPSYYSNGSNGTNINTVSDGVGLVGPTLGLLAKKPSHRMYCKAGGERFAVAVRDGKVVLARPNPTDPTQHWYKDDKYSTKVKDEERHPSFVYVNKGTGQAIKHSVSGHPVQLVPYKPGVFDVSILWTESNDLGNGYRTIRTVNNTSLVMDAWNGDKDHGGVHDGTTIAVFKCWKGDNQNQQWKFIPY